jgi:MFS family permease
MIEFAAQAMTSGEATSPSLAYPSWRAWYAQAVLQAQILVAGIEMSIVTLLVQPIETAFRISDVQFATITATALSIGVTIGYYPAGVLADTFRRRDVMAIGCVLWTLAAIVVIRANSQEVFFIGRLLAGIGIALTQPATFSLLSDAFPRERRAFAIGAYTVGLALGNGVGLASCGALAQWAERNGALRIGFFTFSPWQQCFVAIAMFGALVVLLVMTIREPSRNDRSTVARSTVRSSLAFFLTYIRRHWLLWILMLSGSQIGAAISFALATWAPAFAQRNYGLTGVAPIALLGTFTAAGTLVGSLCGMIVAQRSVNTGKPFALPRTLIAAQAICCFFSFVFPFMPSWLLANVAMAGLQAATMVQSTLSLIAVQETVPNEARGQINSLFGLVVLVPQILGATLVAALASGKFAAQGGLAPAFLVVGAATGFFGLAAFILALRPYQRAWTEMRTLKRVPSETS